jgi:hypothetical protein
VFGRDWEPATAKIVAKKFKEEQYRARLAELTGQAGS